MKTNLMSRFLSVVVTLVLAMTIFVSFNTETFALSKPGKVKTVSAKAVSADSVKLSWKKVSGASGYQIYKVTKSGSKKFATVKSASKKTITIKKLKPDTKYTYKVRAFKKYKKSGKTRTIYGKFSNKVSITLSSAITVSTQPELNKALTNKAASQITINTADKVALEIHSGDYRNVDLVVDAPNADITNRGQFKTITINQISADTWTELARDNVFIINATAGHVVVPTSAEIREIRIEGTNSNFVLDIEGDVEKVVVDSKAKLTINTKGHVDSVEVNDQSTININGSGSTEPVDIIVSAQADKTAITSNTKVNVYASADTEISLSAGAEGSTVKTENKDMSVEVTNNTAAAVAVTSKEGTVQNVESGKTASIDGAGNVKESTDEEETSGGGGGGTPSGGGGGSSSGGDEPTPSGDNSKEDIIPNYLTVVKYEEVERDYDPDDDGYFSVYYAITNNSNKTVRVEGVYKNYDTNGYQTGSADLWGYDGNLLSPGQTGLFLTDELPLVTDRNTGYIDMSGTEITDSEHNSALGDIQITHQEVEDGISLTFKNNSQHQIGRFGVRILMLDENNKVLYQRYAYSSKIYAPGYEDTVKVEYRIQYVNGHEEIVKPASYLIFANGASIKDTE